MNYDKFTVYNASAGSGKTYTITEVLANKLKDSQNLRPEQIIATTFTEKAAAELEGRIRTKLLDGDQLAQAQALPAALIGTVNSVTNAILQKFAIDAGLNPDLSVIDENAQGRVFRIATEKTLYDREVENADLIERVGYSTKATTYGAFSISWSQDVKRICDLARANDISPDQLAGFADKSAATLAEALGGEVIDVREAYVAHIKQEIAGIKETLQADLASATTKTAANPINTGIAKCDEAVERLEATVQSWDGATWRDLEKGLTTSVLGHFNRPTKAIKERFLEPEVSFSVTQDGNFIADLQQFIHLTFDVARECMMSYAEYKKALGLVDFIDQEHQTLQLLRERDDVRASIKSQYKLLVVDEFQDTSPLQLAIFMELAELVDEVIWVGDPKQSIYRFRGADPQLMKAALQEISAHHAEGIHQLGYSYRTRAVPLNFSNQIFKRTFKDLYEDEKSIVLDVPEQLAEKHSGGAVRLWRPLDDDTTSTQLVAAGIAAEIAGNPDEDVERAVLVRTNDEVYKVVAALTQLGIPVLGDHFDVAQTREGIALHAALAFALDQRDTKALIELIQILHEHPAHNNWLEQLTAAPNREARLALLREWAADPALTGLRDLSAYTGVLAPTDFVRRAIDAIDLVRYISTWNNTSKRFTALDGVVQAATDYEERAVADQRVPSVQGFLDYLDDYRGAPATRSPRQKNAVHVLTMHKAKGLEWDRVYVAIGDHEVDARFKPVGSWVITHGTMDVQDALANRVLYFWPESLKNFGDAMLERLTQHPLQADLRTAEIEEEQRLYYVALTRSKSRTVLALETGFETSMPELFFNSKTDRGLDIQVLRARPSAEEMVELREAEREKLRLEEVSRRVAEAFPEITNEEEEYASVDLYNKLVEELVLDGIDDAVLDQRILADCAEGDTPQALFRFGKEQDGERVDVTLQSFLWAEAQVLPTDVSRSARAALEPAEVRSPVVEERTFVPARFAASSIKPSEEQVQRASATLLAGGDLGAALVDGGGKDWDLVGDAVHGFLALPTASMSDEAKSEAADRITLRWGLDNLAVSQPRTILLEAARRWDKWIEQNYPASEGWEVLTEVPFTWTDADSRSASGWIDTLLMREVGGKTETVLVDHKTYPGKEPAKHLLDKYVGQMTAYSQVLEAQTGAKPLQILMHLPMRGEVWEMKLG